MKELNNVSAIYEYVNQAQKAKYHLIGIGKRRKNNRANTRGRKTQYIKCIDERSFPPKFFIKCIKHIR